MNTFDSTFGYQMDQAFEAETDSRLPAWCAFLLGSVVTFLLVFVGVARPLMQEMGTVRRQLMLVQQNVVELTAYGEGVQGGNHLLASLKEQEALVEEGAQVLDALQGLKARLDLELADIGVIGERLEELTRLKGAVAEAVDRVDEAQDVLTAAEVLHQRLLDAAASMQVAMETGNQLVTLGETIAAERATVVEARNSLEHMVELRGQLTSAGENSQQALEDLQGLIRVKEMVLAHSTHLVDAIETLELANDLHAQFELAAKAFTQIRLWMLDVIAAEPAMRQAQQALAPLTELTNLRRLNASDLRGLVQALSREGAPRLAERSDVAPAEGATKSTQ